MATTAKKRKGQPDWEFFKPIILAKRRMLNRKTYTMEHIFEELKSQYDCDIKNVYQLEHQVRKWAITKPKHLAAIAVPKEVLLRMSTIREQRSALGKQTIFSYRGVDVPADSLDARFERLKRAKDLESKENIRESYASVSAAKELNYKLDEETSSQIRSKRPPRVTKLYEETLRFRTPTPPGDDVENKGCTSQNFDLREKVQIVSPKITEKPDDQDNVDKPPLPVGIRGPSIEASRTASGLESSWWRVDHQARVPMSITSVEPLSSTVSAPQRTPDPQNAGETQETFKPIFEITELEPRPATPIPNIPPRAQDCKFEKLINPITNKRHGQNLKTKGLETYSLNAAKSSSTSINFDCPFPNCQHKAVNTDSLYKHLFNWHETVKYGCIVPDCDYCCLRKEDIAKHLRESHKEIIEACDAASQDTLINGIDSDNCKLI